MPYPTEAKRVRATHRYYPERVRFLGEIPHAKSTREVAIDVAPETICRIADALRATRGQACHALASNVPPHLRDEEWHVGHAMWHVDHPDRPMPCIDHSKVIDMQSLPSGDEETAPCAPESEKP